MHSAAVLVGLVASLAQAGVIDRRAEINDCLSAAGVPMPEVGTAGYTNATAPFNIRLPKYTHAAVAEPTEIGHIQAAVSCGKKLGVKVTARSGGHSYANFGLGGESGHLIVALDKMDNVTMDGSVAVAQPGIRLGHLATTLYEKYKRAIAHGTCPGVGISGHFLHGGFGFSSHKYGLALDQILQMTVVLANATVVNASATENPDLFWALRGAGSNFGIVANWRIQTFPAPENLTWFNVDLKWTKDTAAAGLDALEKYARDEMPSDINFRVSDYSRGQPGIEGLFYGDDAGMRAAIGPLLKAAAPNANITESHAVNWLDAVVHYSYFPTVDWTWPSPQENFYSKSIALPSLSGASAKAFVDYWYGTANNITDRGWWFQLDMHGGKNSAITKKTNADSAYALRDKLYIIQFYDRFENDQLYPAEDVSFLDGWVSALAATYPEGAYGMYINYADPRLERKQAEKLYYGSNLAKLQQLKAVYDPTELFYYPLSIEPAK